MCTCDRRTIRGQQWASSPREPEQQVFVSDLCGSGKLNLVPGCWHCLRRSTSCPLLGEVHQWGWEILKHPAFSICLVGDGSSQLPVGAITLPAPPCCACPLHAPGPPCMPTPHHCASLLQWALPALELICTHQNKLYYICCFWLWCLSRQQKTD